MSPQTDILIVTATEVESRAMLSAFAQHSGQPAQPVPAGDRVYHDLGHVADRHAMLVLCEMGALGLGSSLVSVQKAIAALSPAAVVLAGIAFGVDEGKQQIGDLLVSLQLLLYEAQRIGERQQVARGDRPHASTRLINALRNAALTWPQDEARIDFGLMLSGEKLVDNSAYRAQLLQFSPDIIGGEMEGAGLYVACTDAKVDWIVVKAICDFADGNKAVDKDTRQMIAARNAAGFVVHAMSFMPMSSGNGESEVNDQQAQRGNGRSERQLLFECIDTVLTTEDELRAFCFEHFPEVYRNLREIDRRPHITRELIGYVLARAQTDALWQLLQMRSYACVAKYQEMGR
ncbi:MAG TPA: hypothetical protein DDY14_09470 [Chromatiaceae bacterium]|jgi:nucleoside phosphorylase|nr:MAG: hypothetical protein N838_08800 [Thiohalocapsa sp. PB-PSB1]QQO56183.1 MAG: hypothetical protein N838_25315 [Thiohalocapsa sp. PB-PSB1]HBG95532.1 hypothetical protein [Chromatiaceae bacterium]HCS88997.1 hypothetical protein [Chromatiaceae bacterium]